MKLVAIIFKKNNFFQPKAEFTLRRIRSTNSPPGIESDASTSLLLHKRHFKSINQTQKPNTEDQSRAQRLLKRHRKQIFNGIMEALRLDGLTLRGMGQTTRPIAIGSSQQFMQAILHI